MAWLEAKFRLKSSAPMLHNDVKTADPFHPIAIRKKELTSKRKRTKADDEEIRYLNWLGALYIDDIGPCIPGRCVEATIVNGAKKERNGPLAKSGVFCDQNFSLQYDGPRDIDGLYANESFIDTQMATVQRAKVVRCRPIFKEWVSDVVVNYDDEIVNLSQVSNWLMVAGKQCGIGDYRPKYGRFEVETEYSLSA